MTTALSGKRVLVTRARAQAASLCAKLARAGAQTVVFPTIEIAPMQDWAALDEAISRLSRYHWVIFTSVNGVAAFWERLAAMGMEGRAFAAGREAAPTKAAAIGPATARALAQRGVKAQLVPGEYVAEAIVAEIGEVAGQWILLPRAEMARETLAQELARRGAVVHEIAAYRTLPAAPDPGALAALRGGVDAITFTSSSTARNFVALAGRATYGAAVACIGPITAQTARELGLPVDVIAGEYTTDGLVAALADYFSRSEH